MLVGGTDGPVFGTTFDLPAKTIQLEFQNVQVGAPFTLTTMTVVQGAGTEEFCPPHKSINDKLRLMQCLGCSPSGEVSNPHRIVATFENIGEAPLSDVFFRVQRLSGPACVHCTVENADGVPGGIASRLTVPPEALGPGGILSPGGQFTQEFLINWQNPVCCVNFFVEVAGTNP
jgi:hypothetical protein